MHEVKVVIHFSTYKRAFSYQTGHSVQDIRAAIEEVAKKYEPYPMFLGYTLLINKIEKRVKI